MTVKPEEQEPDTPYIGLANMPQRSITLGDWGHASDATSAKSAFAEDDILCGKLRPYFISRLISGELRVPEAEAAVEDAL